jgi:F-type H+-transporting ATPase subunit b
MTRGRLGVAVRNARIAAVVIGVVVLMLPALGLAASEGGEGAGLIEINRSLLIQLLNFLLLLLVLYRFLYRPLVAALDGRSAAIKQQLAEAEAAREEAKRQLAELEGRLRAAQAEAQATRERVLREAAELRERLTAEARQEAARLVETAQTEIAHATRQARTELRAEVGALAIEVAEHLIRRNLRDEDHQRLVREAVARIGAA